jgi:hypothetical protein
MRKNRVKNRLSYDFIETSLKCKHHRITLNMKLTDKQKEEREFQLRMSKIQIYADKCHAGLSAKLSFVVVFIGFIIFFYSFWIQATIAGNPYSSTGLIGIFGTISTTAVVFSYLVKYMTKYNSDIKRISNMIEAVRKGDDLPTLEQMDSCALHDLSKTK